MRVEMIEKGPEVEETYAALQKGFGQVANLFKTLAQRPPVMKAVLNLSNSLMIVGTVERKLKEKIALKISTTNKCNYCIIYHSVALRRLGLAESEIRLVEEPSKLPAAERVCLEYVEKVTKNPNSISDHEFSQLKKHFTQEQIVEITAVACLFNFLNRFLDALDVPVDEVVVFEYPKASA